MKDVLDIAKDIVGEEWVNSWGRNMSSYDLDNFNKQIESLLTKPTLDPFQIIIMALVAKTQELESKLKD